MEDKKVLNNEELEKVTGGFDNYWYSFFTAKNAARLTTSEV